MLFWAKLVGLVAWQRKLLGLGVGRVHEIGKTCKSSAQKKNVFLKKKRANPYHLLKLAPSWCTLNSNYAQASPLKTMESVRVCAIETNLT